MMDLTRKVDKSLRKLEDYVAVSDLAGSLNSISRFIYGHYDDPHYTGYAITDDQNAKYKTVISMLDTCVGVLTSINHEQEYDTIEKMREATGQ